MREPAAMQKQIDDLEFENAELRKALSAKDARFPRLRLTPSELEVMRVLVKHEMASKAMIELALRDADGLMERDPKVVDVHLFKIRRKLKPFGVVITNTWGQGWSLDKEWRHKIMGEAA